MLEKKTNLMRLRTLYKTNRKKLQISILIQFIIKK